MSGGAARRGDGDVPIRSISSMAKKSARPCVVSVPRAPNVTRRGSAGAPASAAATSHAYTSLSATKQHSAPSSVILASCSDAPAAGPSAVAAAAAASNSGSTSPPSAAAPLPLRTYLRAAR